jgi:acetoin utilization protein AcuB
LLPFIWSSQEVLDVIRWRRKNECSPRSAGAPTQESAMKRIPRISALMTAFPWHLTGEVSVIEARRFMQEHDIHHLPVTDNQHRLLGVVTLDTLPPGSNRSLAQYVLPAETVDASQRADLVLAEMAERHLPLVVVMHRNRLAGIFTHTDACRQFASYLREPFWSPGGGDVA